MIFVFICVVKKLRLPRHWLMFLSLLLLKAVLICVCAVNDWCVCFKYTPYLAHWLHSHISQDWFANFKLKYLSCFCVLTQCLEGVLCSVLQCIAAKCAAVCCSSNHPHCQVSHDACVWHESSFIQVRDVTHSWCDMTHSYVGHDVQMRYRTHPHVWRDLFKSWTCVIHQSDIQRIHLDFDQFKACSCVALSLSLSLSLDVSVSLTAIIHTFPPTYIHACTHTYIQATDVAVRALESYHSPGDIATLNMISKYPILDF